MQLDIKFVNDDKVKPNHREIIQSLKKIGFGYDLKYEMIYYTVHECLVIVLQKEFSQEKIRRHQKHNRI
jgi:hypothetical protein